MKKESVAPVIKTALVVAVLGIVACDKSPKSANQAGSIRMSRVSSSAMKSVGYDASKRVLAIEFHNGAVYHYSDVPEDVYHGLMQASSHGKYFHRHIKGAGYRYRRVIPLTR